MKRYIVQYTVSDGEYEYGDRTIFSTDVTGVDDFTKAFINSRWELDEDELTYDEILRKWGLYDGRYVTVDSYGEIPEEDFNVLAKYL